MDTTRSLDKQKRHQPLGPTEASASRDIGAPFANSSQASVAPMDYSFANISVSAPPIQEKSDKISPNMQNATSLPESLKSGAESLSGLSLDDVRVHYNSSKPAEVAALAYAQGTDIHVAPGQEEHLPHEAWHVVQQKQGRVAPTLQVKGAFVNDDQNLEHEAEVMGQKIK